MNKSVLNIGQQKTKSSKSGAEEPKVGILQRLFVFSYALSHGHGCELQHAHTNKTPPAFCLSPSGQAVAEMRTWIFIF